MSQTQLETEVGVENSSTNNAVYEDATHITQLPSHKQSSYSVVFDTCSQLSGQAVLDGSEQLFYFAGNASAVVDSIDATVDDFTVGGEVYGQLVNSTTTTQRRYGKIGMRNPFEATEVVSSYSLYDRITDMVIEDISIDERGVVKSIPDDIAPYLVPEGTAVDFPSQVYVIENKFGTVENKDSIGRPTFDTKEHCRGVLDSRNVGEDFMTEFNKRLSGVLKLDQFFFDNGLSHDDLVGTRAYNAFLQWYGSPQWKDVGVAQSTKYGSGTYEYRLLENDSLMVV